MKGRRKKSAGEKKKNSIVNEGNQRERWRSYFALKVS
jgi:hypothetical protein